MSNINNIIHNEIENLFNNDKILTLKNKKPISDFSKKLDALFEKTENQNTSPNVSLNKLNTPIYKIKFPISKYLPDSLSYKKN